MNRHDLITVEFAQLVICIFLVSTITFLTFLAHKYGGSMIDGLKGHNSRWDAPEVIIIFFLPVSIVMLLIDVFIGFRPSGEAYLFAASGLGIGAGMRAGIERGIQRIKTGMPRMSNPSSPPEKKPIEDDVVKPGEEG